MHSVGPIMVAGFYRFVELPDYVQVRDTIRLIGNRIGIKGSILIAPEGVNGTICSEKASMLDFFSELASDGRFEDLEKRVSFCENMPFGRFKARLKKEIVTMKSPFANPDLGVGEYVEPQAWNALISDPEVLVIDVRNRYETEMGTFTGAVDPQTDFFSDFPKFVEENLTSKTQTIATFCTGGIRCEKATAYLRSLGFENVKHLKGGILSYLEQTSSHESLWKGQCFVFDDRTAVDQNLEPVNKSESTLYDPWPRRSLD